MISASVVICFLFAEPPHHREGFVFSTQPKAQSRHNPPPADNPFSFFAFFLTRAECYIPIVSCSTPCLITVYLLYNVVN